MGFDYLGMASFGTDEIIETAEVVELILPSERGLCAEGNGSNIEGTSLVLNSPTMTSESRSTVLSTSEKTVSPIQDSIGLSFLAENNLQNSMSEQDIKDVLFKAGYSINEIEEIVAANADKDGVEDSLNSSISVNSMNSDVSESADVNAFDALKEIRVKNVGKIVIGTLNIKGVGGVWQKKITGSLLLPHESTCQDDSKMGSTTSQSGTADFLSRFEYLQIWCRL